MKMPLSITKAIRKDHEIYVKQLAMLRPQMVESANQRHIKLMLSIDSVEQVSDLGLVEALAAESSLRQYRELATGRSQTIAGLMVKEGLAASQDIYLREVGAVLLELELEALELADRIVALSY